MARPLVRPPEQVVRQVLDQGVVPLLKRIERDLKTPLELRVESALAPGITTERIPPGQNVAAVASGVLRLAFRMNYGGDRFHFVAEAVFPRDLSPSTGFSGFNATGSVDVEGATYNLKSDSWTVQYNVWEFTV